MTASKPTLDDLRIERGDQPGPDRRLGLVIALLAVVLALGGGAWWFLRPKPVAVHTALARELAAAGSAGPQRTVLNASGYVTARRQATVSSKVTGKVVELLIEEGMKVAEGQVLARLDDSNIKTSLDVAQAQLDSARMSVEETRAQLKQADLEFQRTTELAKKKISSQSDLDKAESDAMSLRAHLAVLERNVLVAERQVDQCQTQMDDMVIRAPFSGVVTTKDAQPGEMISPVSAGGGFTRTGIGTVVDMSSLEIEIDVNENYIGRVEPGQPVEATLDAYPDWKIPCKVIAIIPTADRDKSTVKVRVGFDKLDPRILPDMSVKVAFRDTAAAGPASATPRVSIPKAALRQRDGKDIVLVVRDGRVERRAVTVGGTDGDDTWITAGLSAGDKVALDGPDDLADGAAVREVQP
jgi:RND family efflux transporter MFP subunit